MSLHQKIIQNLKEAMKASREFEVGVLRMLLSSLHNKEIEKKGKGLEPILSDEEVVEVLSREAKKRKEAIEAYIKGNRNDLADKEKKELEIIQQYLPKQLTEEEIEKTVTAIIERTGIKDMKRFGQLMSELMKELKGRVDASLVSDIVKKKLENGDS